MTAALVAGSMNKPQVVEFGPTAVAMRYRMMFDLHVIRLDDPPALAPATLRTTDIQSGSFLAADSKRACPYLLQVSQRRRKILSAIPGAIAVPLVAFFHEASLYYCNVAQ
jgi:hypothetical protein